MSILCPCLIFDLELVCYFSFYPVRHFGIKKNDEIIILTAAAATTKAVIVWEEGLHFVETTT